VNHDRIIGLAFATALALIAIGIAITERALRATPWKWDEK
jgi:hypothetical protein